MEFVASAEKILPWTCHAHPTIAEAVREAALACGGRCNPHVGSRLQ